MKTLLKLGLFLTLGITSCGVSKSYFTVDVRNRVEKQSITIDKLQFYVDRDVELRRELTIGETEVTSGTVKLENGKNIHIIILKKNTPGVCTKINENSMEVSFEMGDGKNLVFGVPKDAEANTVYGLEALKWVNEGSKNELGKIKYDGKIYFIQPNGVGARLMIRKSVANKLEIEKSTMHGRKVE